MQKFTSIIRSFRTIHYNFASLNFHGISNFSPELAELREGIEKFAKDKVAPLADSSDKDNNFPNHLWKEFGDMGLLGITCPTQYGGSDLGYTAHCIAMEELSKASAGIALSYGAHSALNLAQIVRFGSEAQKQKYLPKLCSGEYIGALAMSEPNSGSDVMSMKTRAKKVGNKYIINGSKMWITNGPDADVIVVYARTDQDKPKSALTAFIVEKGFKGFKVAQKLDKLGMRNSNTGELVFEDCEVPEENVLGELNRGSFVLMNGLDYERLVLAAGPVGIMQAAFDLSRDYCMTRKQFGQRIGDFQIMQAKLADMYTSLQSSRAMVYSIAKQVDEGQLSNVVTKQYHLKNCASVILYTSTQATQVALEAIQTLGGNGYINDYPAGRLLRDAKLYEIGAGTNEIRRWLIGREIMKE